MGQLLKALLFLVLAGVATARAAAWDYAPDWAHAPDWEIDLDGRLVSVNGLQPFIDGELGAARYGGDESGARIGRVRFAVA